MPKRKQFPTNLTIAEIRDLLENFESGGRTITYLGYESIGSGDAVEHMNVVDGVALEAMPREFDLVATSEKGVGDLISERTTAGDRLDLVTWIYIKDAEKMVALFRKP